MRRELLQTLFAALDASRLISLVFQHAGQRLPDQRFVVDDQNRGLLHAERSGADSAGL